MNQVQKMSPSIFMCLFFNDPLEALIIVRKSLILLSWPKSFFSFHSIFISRIYLHVSVNAELLLEICYAKKNSNVSGHKKSARD